MYFVLDGPVSGEVRLYFDRYSISYSERGRVEVYISEEWGTVSGTWTLQNAEIVCSQLGFDIPSKTHVITEHVPYILHISMRICHYSDFPILHQFS